VKIRIIGADVLDETECPEFVKRQTSWKADLRTKTKNAGYQVVANNKVIRIIMVDQKEEQKNQEKRQRLGCAFSKVSRGAHDRKDRLRTELQRDTT
jgi:hypothetical protein